MLCIKNLNVIRGAVLALVSCGLLTNIASAQEPDPRDLLKQMSDEIAGLQTFSISGDAFVDARLDAGLIIEHASQANMIVRKPDLVRISNQSSEDLKELYFSSGELTVYTKSMNFYAQKEIPGDAKSALDFAVDELGIDVPMLDFVAPNIDERMLENATDVQYFATSLIRGRIYHHIVIRTSEIDVQLWIAAEGRPLPGKMAISAKWDAGSPRTIVFMDWNTEPNIPSGTLSFVPPNGATRISFATQTNAEEQ